MLKLNINFFFPIWQWFFKNVSARGGSGWASTRCGVCPGGAPARPAQALCPSLCAAAPTAPSPAADAGGLCSSGQAGLGQSLSPASLLTEGWNRCLETLQDREELEERLRQVEPSAPLLPQTQAARPRLWGLGREPRGGLRAHSGRAWGKPGRAAVPSVRSFLFHSIPCRPRERRCSQFSSCRLGSRPFKLRLGRPRRVG